jgi:hypothetical protein
MLFFPRSVGAQPGRVWECFCELRSKRLLNCSIYYLVIYRRNIGEGCLAVNNAVLTPTLNALISLDNVRLEVVAIIRNQPFGKAECSLAFSAHC